MKEATDAGKPFRVICIKTNGARAEFARYASLAEAELVSSRLTAWRCRNEIESPFHSANTQKVGA